MAYPTKPVLIAGAGPTGMMAALELSRFGIPVRLVERALEPATTSRAVGVQARTLELFEQRGLAAALVEKGNQGVAVSTYGGGKRVFRLSFEHTDSRYRYILLVSQAETEKVLREAITNSGVVIEWGTTMVAFGRAEGSDGLAATIRRDDGSIESIECSYLISAEGAHSIVRQTLGLSFEGKTISEDYALGDFLVDGDLPDTDLHIFSSEHGFMGMFPMGGQRFRMIASNPISKPSKSTKPELEELQAMYDQRSHIRLRLHDLTWSSWFRINSRMVERMQVERSFVGGDAAHIHSPAGAQGMNTGIQDMVDLCWKLALVLQGRAKTEIIDTYSAERIPVIRGVLAKTENLTHAIGEENRVFRSVFNLVAPWVAGTEFVQHSSTEGMSQLAITYRESPLASDHGHAGELRAGDRMPDLLIRHVDGTSCMTTFRLMNPSRFTAFCSYADESAEEQRHIEETIGTWRDLIDFYAISPDPAAEKEYKRLLGRSASIILVRPDGYVGFIGSAGSTEELRAYLDRWLIPTAAGLHAA